MHAHFRRQWMIEQERTHPVPTVAPPTIEAPPPSNYDISSPVVVKKSNPRVIKPPVIAAALSIKPPLVVIDISNDPETDSHNEKMESKSVATVADVDHQQPKEKATGTKSKIQPKTVASVKENKSQPIRRQK